MRISLISLLLGGFLLISIVSEGADVDFVRARQVAMNFFKEKGMIDQPAFGESFPVYYENHLTAYIFNLGNGFVMVSANDAVFPVLAYSFESDYPNNNFPASFEFWVRHYLEQISYAQGFDYKASEAIQKIWSRYESTDFYPVEIKSEVKPLLYSTWHQGCYYNSFFPDEPDGPCDHLWTGCVATAMSQVMKYYNFPVIGTGAYGYNSSYGFVEADFENTVYNWAEMDYHLTDEDSTVAELLYHTAISIHSQFFPNGTGAYDFDARDALVDYFKYSPDAHFYWRASYQGDWKAMLRSELDAGRPVIYGGADSETNAGHTLVCDGYQDTSFFHFNWGWNGLYNGYFYLDSLIVGNNYFDFQHDAVVGIRPDLENIEIYPPLNIQAAASSSLVTVNWLAPELPSNLELLGYNIFRNGMIINHQINEGLTFTDANAPAGWQQYSVSAVYAGGEKISGEIAEVFVEGSAIAEFSHLLFTVYPNPATDYLCIRQELGSPGKLKLTIEDLTGRSVLAGDYLSDENSPVCISLSGVAKGVYLLNINSEASTVTQKIVIR